MPKEFQPKGSTDKYLKNMFSGEEQEPTPETTNTTATEPPAAQPISTPESKAPTVEELQALLKERDARIAELENDRRLALRIKELDGEPQDKRVSFSIGKSYLDIFSAGAKSKGLSLSAFFKRLVIEYDERKGASHGA